VVLLAAVASAAFAVAIVALGDDARLGCALNAPVDPAYQAELVGPIDLERTSYQVAITRDGKPIEGAKVCATLAMTGMEAMGVSDAAAETAPGTYEVQISFQMSGRWEGNILIAASGERPVEVPLKIVVS
jgi:hypothetical protein